MKPFSLSKLIHRAKVFNTCLAVCALTILPPAAIAIPIVNHSFELPDLAAGSTLVAATPTGWAAASGAGFLSPLMFDRTVAAGGWPAAQDDSQYVGISSTLGPVPAAGITSLSQSFTVVVDGDYLLAWFDNAVTGVSGTPYTVSVEPTLGLPLSSSLSAPLGASSWSARSVPLSLAAGDYTLTFKSVPGAGITVLDNVSLEAVASTSVPETGATVGLLALAICGMTLLRGKSRNQAAGEFLSRAMHV